MSDSGETNRRLIEPDRTYLMSLVHAIQDNPDSDPGIYVDDLIRYGEACVEQGRAVEGAEARSGILIDPANVCSKGTVSIRKLNQGMCERGR